MIAICVDDEEIPLTELKKAVESSEHITKVHDFTDEAKALEFAKSGRVDVAFLDIKLHGMNGLELAKHLRKQQPDVSIVFCTGYEKYALETIKMHIDAGYILKPVRKEHVHEEIEHIVNVKEKKRKVRVVCFGDFEVYIDNMPVSFKRKMTKELFAYLIDRRGANVSIGQICTILWEDDGKDEKKHDYVYHLISDIKTTFKNVGIEDIILSGSMGYAVNVNTIDCDYYRLLECDEAARRSFMGEYMSAYSWAESTCAYLNKNIGGGVCKVMRPLHGCVVVFFYCQRLVRWRGYIGG